MSDSDERTAQSVEMTKQTVRQRLDCLIDSGAKVAEVEAATQLFYAAIKAAYTEAWTSVVMEGRTNRSKQGSLFFYQLEAHVGNCWEAVPEHAYACRPGLFRAMFDLLSLAADQRLRRVGDSLNFPERNTKSSWNGEGQWKPTFLFTGVDLKNWPVK